MSRFVFMAGIFGLTRPLIVALELWFGWFDKTRADLVNAIDFAAMLAFCSAVYLALDWLLDAIRQRSHDHAG